MQRRKRTIVLGCGLILALLIPLMSFWWPTTATHSSLPQMIYEGGLKVPDFSRISLHDLHVSRAGQIDFGDGDVLEWASGDSLDSILRLGNYGDRFSASLDDLLRLTGRSTELRLSDVGVFDRLRVGELVEAVPSLAEYPVGRVRPIADLLTPLGVESTTTLGQVISNSAARSRLVLGSVDLSRYSLSSIPELSRTPLDQFEGWQNISLNRVPALGTVSLQSLSQLLATYTSSEGQKPFTTAVHQGDIASPVIARVDIVWGSDQERETLRTATGSDQDTFHRSCFGQSCPHFEVAPDCIGGNCLQFANPLLHGGLEGRQIVNGRYHQVRGGIGPLGAVCGFREPAGRFSYELLLGNREFKTVLVDQSEEQGTVQFALYTRICEGILGCTPYCIGPIPLGSVASYREGEAFLM